MSQTILIADGDRDVLQLLSSNLEGRGYRVLTASDGREAVLKAQARPDLILLDIMLPDMDGWEVARQLKRDEATAPIPLFVVTAKASELDEVIGFELGAADYIRKPVSIEALMARIRYALRAMQPLIDTIAHDGVLRVDGIEIRESNFTVLIDGREVFFPKKEFELLSFLARNRDRIHSRESLLNAVWGEGVGIHSRTVDVHVRKVREKLRDRSRHIVTVKRVGYKFTEHPVGT
jgi:two-component system alkaline phosphatase synthesis response regulator PhoP